MGSRELKDVGLVHQPKQTQLSTAELTFLGVAADRWCCSYTKGSFEGIALRLQPGDTGG